MKGECKEISWSTLFFMVNTWRWKVNHMWVKIAGKDSQYRNQFTQQSSHLRKFNTRRGDTLRVPTVKFVAWPQWAVLLMCIPVSLQANLTYLGQRACTGRLSTKSCLWLHAKEKQHKSPYPLYKGDDRRQTPHQKDTRNPFPCSSLACTCYRPVTVTLAPGPLPALTLPSEQPGPELPALLLPPAAAGPAELLPGVGKGRTE